MKGIIFTSDSVRAILNGTKTQTRRVIKPPFSIPANRDITKISKRTHGGMKPYPPKYNIGETLYVKEAYHCYLNVVCGSYGYEEGEEVKYPPHIVIDGIKRPVDFKEKYPKASLKWSSPLYMPESAARIYIEIVSVRVERLQDITEEDARAEGVRLVVLKSNKELNWADDDSKGKEWIDYGNYLLAYKNLWDSINKKHTWESNPFVWVYEFKRKEK